MSKPKSIEVCIRELQKVLPIILDAAENFHFLKAELKRQKTKTKKKFVIGEVPWNDPEEELDRDFLPGQKEYKNLAEENLRKNGDKR